MACWNPPTCRLFVMLPVSAHQQTTAKQLHKRREDVGLNGEGHWVNWICNFKMKITAKSKMVLQLSVKIDNDILLYTLYMYTDISVRWALTDQARCGRLAYYPIVKICTWLTFVTVAKVAGKSWPIIQTSPDELPHGNVRIHCSNPGRTDKEPWRVRGRENYRVVWRRIGFYERRSTINDLSASIASCL